MAAQVAIAIENARLYQAVTRQEQQLERDIAMAREVQLRLLPTGSGTHTRRHGGPLFARAHHRRRLYDFLEYGPNQSAIVLGDVSGKAAPAALFAALVSGIMRSAANQRLEPAAMLRMLNDALQERRLESQYVDHAVCAVERREPDPATGQLGGGAAGVLPRRGVGDRFVRKGFRSACFPM